VKIAGPDMRRKFSLIRRSSEYHQLVKLLDRLIDEVGENEDHPLASFMEVIGVLIEKYEDDKVPVLS
jgi:HTH-type transcriptional regulator/antitoxin HigA